ncbi:hypothetical protein HOY80DRAFT_987144 [Tuber brumale]|nr:hypothetical protein HOY80DRAFT_987144 [Tuber brumale]
MGTIRWVLSMSVCVVTDTRRAWTKDSQAAADLLAARSSFGNICLSSSSFFPLLSIHLVSSFASSSSPFPRPFHNRLSFFLTL